jgi:hypothetical protein
MVLTNESIEKRLAEAHLKIINAMEDNKISPLLATFGYDEVRFGEGLQLYDTAYSLHQVQKKEYGDQFMSTEEFQRKWEGVNRTYMHQLTIGRVALKEYPALLKLTGIMGERKASYFGWLCQTRQFYAKSLENRQVCDMLAKFGVTEEMMTAAQQEVEAVENLRNIQSRETGDAQEATAKRDLALDALEAWVADLVAVARVALVDSPQLLEKLGITVSP